MLVDNNSSTILQLNQVSFRYSSLQSDVIHDLTIDFNRGEIITLMAPSGTGKSTIFKLITRLEQPTNGSIELFDSINHPKTQIGYMPQQDLLLNWRTILDNVILPLELIGMSRKKREQIGIERMNTFGLAGTEKLYPHQLSGGMRQRANFLRATLTGETLLLLDEPFSALDAMTRLSMQTWLLEQWEQAKTRPTLIFISHDIDEALFLSDRVVVFTDSPLSLYKTINVPFKRPRTHEQLLTDEGIHLKKEVMALFDRQVQHL